jgi:trehalose 6-phosphate synthase
MRRIVLITAAVMAAVSLVVGISTLNQASQEQIALTSRLQSRTQLLAESLSESIEPSVEAHATSTIARVVNHFVDNQRLAGLSVTDSAGTVVFASDAIPDSPDPKFVATVMDSDEPNGLIDHSSTSTYYIFTTPLHNDADTVVGALTIVQNAGYIDDSVRAIWWGNVWRLMLQLVLFAAAIYVLVRWVFFKPLTTLLSAMESARRGEKTSYDPHQLGVFRPLVSEVGKMTASLREARFAASEEARMRLEKLDSPWTAERLKEFVKGTIKNRAIYVVSNREPYVHTRNKKALSYSVPASGMVTALEAVMDACGGMWIAHGSGNADKEVADSDGKLKVPPDEPRYTLKRIWLSDEDVQGFYTGFSNEALWPLCHMAHNRPIFREEDWIAYRKVNGTFAKAILEEIRHEQQPIVLIQDYHFGLLPAMIKKSRPDAQVGLFWHIPWPSSEQFSICPWRKELLTGILGADVIGFHIQQYCNNFMETVAKEIESIVDFEQFSVTKEGHTSFIKPFPISIPFTSGTDSEEDERGAKAALEKLGITSEFVGLGVDRLDYMKGILERLKAVEFFFDTYPDFRGRCTFVQIAAPSRESVEKYRQYATDVMQEVERINAKFATDGWKPIVFEHRQYSHEELRPLYRAADFCLVSSLHDGMNLVAKEYVAVRNDEQGVLILSQFAGASRSLSGAIVVNPYSAEESAEAIHAALVMPPAEQHRRMKSMRVSVRDYNVYKWAAEFLRAVATLG